MNPYIQIHPSLPSPCFPYHLPLNPICLPSLPLYPLPPLEVLPSPTSPVVIIRHSSQRNNMS